MTLPNNSILPRFSVSRPVTVLMIFIGLLVVGYIASERIPLQLMPSGFTPPFLVVRAPYPDANPEEVENQLTRPIEEILGTVSGISEVYSTSSRNGCFLFVEFSQRVDMTLAYNDVRDRMDRVLVDLPDEVERVFVWKYNPNDEPILFFGASIEGEVTEPFYLVEQYVRKRFERVEGVGQVEVWGLWEKSIQIEVDQDAVLAHNVNLYDLVGTLQTANFNLASGHVSEGGKKLYVRSMGKFESVEEIRNIRLGGSGVRLADIAEVKYDLPEITSYNRIDGKPGVLFGIYKESAANTVAVSKELRRIMDEELTGNPQLEGFTFFKFWDQGQVIKDSLHHLRNTGLLGGCIAIVIIFVFIRRIPLTLVITLSIPISILVTLSVMYFTGDSLNLISLMALMLAVGLLVDNSVVVGENVLRWRQMGASPIDAAIKGASEVGLAIFTATSTTIVVFFPLILMSDDVGFRFYMLKLGVPISIALASSLFVALVFMPLAMTWLSSKKSFKPQRFAVVDWVRKHYLRLLAHILDHRITVSVFLIFFFIVASYPFTKVEFTDDTSGHGRQVRLVFYFPEYFTLEDADRAMLRVEEVLESKREELEFESLSTYVNKEMGVIRSTLVPESEGTLTEDEASEAIREAVPEMPGVEIMVNWQRGQRDENSVNVTLYGPDTRVLVGLAEEVERRIRDIPEILSLDTDMERGGEEIHFRVDRDLTRKQGLTPSTAAAMVGYALRGRELPEVVADDREIDVKVQVRREDRKTLDQLKNIGFGGVEGRRLTLSQLGSFERARGLGDIQRENRKTMLSVTASTSKDNLEALGKEIDKRLAGLTLPHGYSWSKGNRFRQMEESSEAMQFALLLSITFVFLLVGALFESFLLPWAVILSVPFAFYGVYWMMWLTGTPMDLMAMIGMVLLVGIVVNNAIVLVDLVNRLRLEGMNRREAILSAGEHRFRPILITALTTIFGLAPLAFGKASLVGIPYSPLALTVMGGLIASTFLTLLLVPFGYTLFDDLRAAFWRRRRKVYRPDDAA